MRYVNAGHPPIALWGRTREPGWLGSTGPLVSPVLQAPRWDAAAVPMNEGDHVLLYTDGVSEPLADQDGRAEERFMRTIERAPDGGGPLLDAFLADIQLELAGTAPGRRRHLAHGEVVGPGNQQLSGPT